MTVRITAEILANWEAENTPLRRRIRDLELRIFRVRPDQCRESTIIHSWDCLIDAYFRRELMVLEGKRRKQVVKYLRIGWVTVKDLTLNENLHLDRFEVHHTEPSDGNTFRAVLLRNNGEWMVPDWMRNTLNTHPHLRRITETARAMLQTRDECEEVREIASRKWGRADGPAGRGELLLECIEAPFGPQWLDIARQDSGFWQIIRDALKLGIEIGRDELASTSQKAIDQGVAMETIGDGSGLDILSEKISRVLSDIESGGGIKPKPTIILKRLGLKKPAKNLDGPLSSDDAHFNRWLKAEDITFSKFQERVKYLRAKIWGN
jgi:hypothetical protein